MKTEQWTVIGLLAGLLGLEVVRSQNVRSFFSNAYANFQTALGNAQTQNAGASYSSTPHSINQPPPGICVNKAGNGNVPCSSASAASKTSITGI